MKFCIFLCCTTVALAGYITRVSDGDASINSANQAKIDELKPDHTYSPFGHAGDLSAQVSDDGGREGAGAAWQTRVQPSTLLNCTSGKYEAFTLSGLRACFACPMGKFQDIAKQSRCKDCAAGRYGVQAGQSSKGTACNDCPGSKYQPVSGKAFCNDDDETEVCGEGHIKTANVNKRCIACPAGRYSRGLVSGNSINDCLHCPANHYAPHSGMGSCLLCRPGKFNDRSGATYCMWRGKTDVLPPRAPDPVSTCPAGQFKHTSPTGDSVCVQCHAGQYNTADDTSTTCVKCDAGKYNPWQGKTQASDCLDCPNGQLAGASKCIKEAKRQVTQNCPAGEYVSFANERNASSTDLAGDGHKANHAHANIQITCVKCSEGRYRSATQDERQCSSCPVGKQATRSDDKGVSALKADSTYAARKCDPLDYESGAGPNNTHDNRCQNDDRNVIHWMEGADTCTECPKGTAWHLGRCKKCPEGTYQHIPGALQCIPCRAGTWSKPGSEFCDVKTKNNHCTGGRIFTEQGSPCTATCDVRTPNCVSQKVARCQCPAGEFWDDRVQVCRTAAYCDKLAAGTTCGADESAKTEEQCTALLATKPGYTFKKFPYQNMKKHNGCLMYPCGKLVPLTGCYVERWHREYADGDDAITGEGEDWCHTFKCNVNENNAKIQMTSTAKKCPLAPQCSHLRCKFVAGAVKVKYDKLESVGIRHRCGHLDENDPHNCVCTCFS